MTFSYFYIASLLFVGTSNLIGGLGELGGRKGTKPHIVKGVGLPWTRSGHVRGGVCKLIGRFAANSIYAAKKFALFSLF